MRHQFRPSARGTPQWYLVAPEVNLIIAHPLTAFTLSIRTRQHFDTDTALAHASTSLRVTSNHSIEFSRFSKQVVSIIQNLRSQLQNTDGDDLEFLTLNCIMF